MSKSLELSRDVNGAVIQVTALNDPQDVDGSSASAQSSAIDGKLVRICAVSGDIRFLIGSNPVALTTSHFLAEKSEIWVPITVGYKVAILGGVANIATAGL